MIRPADQNQSALLLGTAGPFLYDIFDERQGPALPSSSALWDWPVGRITPLHSSPVASLRARMPFSEPT